VEERAVERFSSCRAASASLLLDTALQTSSFGEDEAGEPYVVDHGGGVHRLLTTP